MDPFFGDLSEDDEYYHVEYQGAAGNRPRRQLPQVIHSTKSFLQTRISRYWLNKVSPKTFLQYGNFPNYYFLDLAPARIWIRVFPEG